MRALIIAILFLARAGTLQASDRYAVFRRAESFQPDRAIDDTAIRLMKTIRSNLPIGWTTLYDPKHRWLEVRRKRSFMAIWGANVPGEMRYQYCLALRIGVMIPIQQYKLLKAENARVAERLSKERKTIRLELFKEDDFIPTTDSERRQVEHYRQIKQTLHHLPDFHFQNIGLSWVLSEDWVSIYDDGIRKECNSVEERVVKLLEKYP